MIEVLARPLLRNRTVPSLALLIAVTMTGTMAMHIFVPAMPAAAADLGASPSLIQSTITLYIIGLAAGQLIYGPLSDRFGRRPVLLFSLALYVLERARVVWTRMTKLADEFLPPPRVLHPWPSVRFAVRHPR